MTVYSNIEGVVHIEMYTRYRRVREKAIDGTLKKVCEEQGT